MATSRKRKASAKRSGKAVSRRAPPPPAALAGNGTGRLEIRLMERGDLEELRLLHNDDPTLARLTDISHVSQVQQEQWFQAMSASRSSRRYVARRRDDRALVGLFRIDRLDLWNRNCLVGMDVAPAQRRQGFAAETFGYILDYLFGQCGLNRVALVTLAGNDAALNLYRKLGFVEEGREREAIFRNGRFQDLIAMGLLASEWRAGRGK